MNTYHVPVLLEEVLEFLRPGKGQTILDCTVGGGGYTLALAERVGSEGEVIGLDMDAKSLERVKKRSTKEGINNVHLIQGNFSQADELIKKEKGGEQEKLDGAVFDLGLSSDQLEDEGRGFSFQEDRPLNMSFSSDDSTREIVNKYSEKDLATLIKEYGEEKFAKRIAEKIVQARKEELITTTGQLKAIIETAVPPKYYKRIHPATKTFQALRIASNKELRNIEESLPRVAGLLKSGGRLAVVSYHSLEDRIVKNYFRQESKDCICSPENWTCTCGHKAQLRILTKKVIFPSVEEIRENPRGRSARLRVAEKI